MNIEKIFSSIDRDTSEFIDFWKDICNIESVSGDIDGINSVADNVEAFAKRLGFAVGRKSFEKTGDSLVIDMCEGGEKRCLFLAHMDTVHEKGAFGYPPVNVDGDIMTGPGVIDCKGGIAVSLLAMKALYENGCREHTRLILTSDEELSNMLAGEDGIDFIKDNAVGFKYAFNCEVGIDGEALVMRKGIIRIKITVCGRSSHAGIAYFDGISAIREMAYKIIEFENKSTHEGTTYNCAIINGGKAANIVPDKCEMIVDIRVRSEEDMRLAVNTVDAVVGNSFVEGTTASYEVISRRPPMMRIPQNEALFSVLAMLSEKYGFGKLNAAESGGGSDSAYTQIAGVPTICGLGTTGEYCHTVREYARISSLAERAKLLASACAYIKDEMSGMSDILKM